MAFVTPSSLAEKYDVIVVGAGAGGGQAAYTLTMDGAKVLMIEAGRNYDPRTETPMFQTPDQAPLRRDVVGLGQVRRGQPGEVARSVISRDGASRSVFNPASKKELPALVVRISRISINVY